MPHELKGLHIELAAPNSYEVVEDAAGHRSIRGQAKHVMGGLPPGTPNCFVHPPRGIEAPIHFWFVLSDGGVRDPPAKGRRR